MMSAHVTEFFIARVAEDKMDTVKTAVEARQATLASNLNYPGNDDMIKDYQLVVNGSYIFFAIVENADTAVEIFNGFTKPE